MTAAAPHRRGAQWPLLVLLGDPAYYGRFHFEPADPLGLRYAPAGADNPNFQARQLPGYTAAYAESSVTAGS